LRGGRPSSILAAPSRERSRVPAESRADPFTGHRFNVEIDGVTAAAFSEVSGLDSTTDVIEYRTGGDPVIRKLPGLHRFGNITLKRGLTKDRSLWEWRVSVVEGRVQRRNGSIILLNAAGEDVLRFNFFNGWPCKWEGPTLNARTNEVAVETIVIAHEGFDLVG
jgi:phage tail-like protein